MCGIFDFSDFAKKMWKKIRFKFEISEKIYKRIPFNFKTGSFYKGFPWEIFFTRKSFVKFFWKFKFESDFFPHFFCKIRKLENSAHLFILNYNWANFQRNRRQKNSSLFSLHFTSLRWRGGSRSSGLGLAQQVFFLCSSRSFFHFSSLKHSMCSFLLLRDSTCKTRAG